MKKIILIIILISQTLYASYNPNMAVSDDKLVQTNYVYKSNGTTLTKGTIYDNGNVGIGTATTTAKLHIYNNINSETLWGLGTSPLATNDVCFGWLNGSKVTLANDASIYGIFLRPYLGANSGVTNTTVSALDSYLQLNPNAGGITDAFAIRGRIWMANNTGTIGNVYSGYFSAPSGGVTLNSRIALYSDNLAIGYTGTTPPTNGIIISGNVGIGSTSPEEKLTVTGYTRASSGYKIGANDINTAGTLSNVAYKNQANTFSTNQIINGDLTGIVSLVAKDITINSGSNGQEMFRFTEAGSASNAALYMKYNGTTSINFNAMSSSNSYFNAGNLGIGTTSPSDKLNIVGNTAAGLTIGGLIAGVGQWSPTIRLVGRIKTFYLQEKDEESRFVIGHTTPSDSNELFTIWSSGNVGIGTYWPTTKLEVIGDIKAGNIKSGGWVRGSEEGQILKMIMQNVTGTAVSVNSTNWTVVASMSYTPVSSTSYVLVEFNTRYDIPGSGPDSFLSRITVGGTQIVYSRQNFINVAGGGGRGSVLFPLMGWYTNSATSALTINAEVKWESTDDVLTSYRDGSTWFKITEIARGYFM